MTLSGIGNYQTMRNMQNKSLYQSNEKFSTQIGANTAFAKAVESETPSGRQDKNSLSVRISSINNFADIFRNAPPVNEAELPEDHFSKSDKYEKMLDSLTGVTYYKNKTKPEIQMTADQRVKFYDFFGSVVNNRIIMY